MVDFNIFFTGDCFKILQFIHQNKENLSFAELKDRLQLEDENNIFLAVSFIKNFGYPVSIRYQSADDQPWLFFEAKPKDVRVSFNLFEWLYLQNKLSHCEEGMVGEIIEKTNQSNALKSLDKFFNEQKNKENLSLGLSEQVAKLSARLHRCVQKHIACMITLSSTKELEIFPHRVVYLEGELTVIGEDLSDRCLVHFPLKDIHVFEPLPESQYETNFSTLEVEDFIHAVRTLNDSEERLILKLSSPEKVNFNPDFIFFANPYVTTNMDGDFIWAASVEVSSELFEWIDSIEGLIDILDPQNIKEEFEKFKLEQSFGQTTLKKAS